MNQHNLFGLTVIFLFVLLLVNEFDEPMDTTSNDANDDRSAQVEVPYEEWRDSMIAKAKAMLAAQQLNSNA